MTTLYLSDLDGTLFTTKKSLSKKTTSLLNDCLNKDVKFAVATARMPYGCDYRLKALNLSTPSILTNGVFLYDFSTSRYLDAKKMNPDAVLKVLDVFEAMDTGVFLYSFFENKIQICYNKDTMTDQTQYYSDRALECCSKVAYQPELKPYVLSSDIVYLACTDTEEKLTPIHQAVQNIPGISCAFYLNIYNGLYCIEIFSDQATKKNALLELKHMLNCDEVVVFGDNLNDLSMFEVADRKYAVANALDSVKECADAIIPSCDEDGVAAFIHREIFGI
ncbi:MAG: HAD-IIB family hydrolase [Eubacterium sp.]|nr:HAD-IIB family hydrolase [Eubacterium sp.]